MNKIFSYTYFFLIFIFLNFSYFQNADAIFQTSDFFMLNDHDYHTDIPDQFIKKADEAEKYLLDNLSNDQICVSEYINYLLSFFTFLSLCDVYLFDLSSTSESSVHSSPAEDFLNYKRLVDSFTINICKTLRLLNLLTKRIEYLEKKGFNDDNLTEMKKIVVSKFDFRLHQTPLNWFNVYIFIINEYSSPNSPCEGGFDAICNNFCEKFEDKLCSLLKKNFKAFLCKPK